MTQNFSVCTWNVNSIRTRLPHVQQFLTEVAPDVLCLQETKVTNDLFPLLEIKELGYEAVFHGQKSYNGVALLSKKPLTQVQTGFGAKEGEAMGEDLGGCRAIRGHYPLPNGETVVVQNVYVPQGQSLDSEKFVLKEQFYTALTQEMATLKGQNVVLCGDFNIAPNDADVDSPKRWANKVMFTDAEKTWLAGVQQSANLHDCLEHVGRAETNTDDFSWWDYRTFGFRNTTKWNAGLRIDHLYATPALHGKTTDLKVHRSFRELERPSDHAPVVATFQI